MIWQGYRDWDRCNRTEFEDEADELFWRKNLHRLLELYDPEYTSDNLKIAEIYRNLGDFERCTKLIKEIGEDMTGFETVKAQFTKKGKAKDSIVFELDV